MSDLNQLLSSVLNENTVAQIGEQLGVDQNQAGNAIQLALPALLGALNKNAQSEDGAQGILNAISKDHDGGILDMLPQFLGNASQGPGAAILGHILGAKQPQWKRPNCPTFSAVLLLTGWICHTRINKSCAIVVIKQKKKKLILKRLAQKGGYRRGLCAAG